MNRLTFWNESLQGGAWDVPIRTSDDAAAFIPSQEIIDRLAAYEDTGWTPDEIREGNALIAEAVRENGRFTGRRLFELCGAESEGRLLVLPCEVGDTIYRICHEYKKGNPFIRAVTFNQNNFWRIVFGGEFGKTVFLTREEAEAALKGGADG